MICKIMSNKPRNKCNLWRDYNKWLCLFTIPNVNIKPASLQEKKLEKLWKIMLKNIISEKVIIDNISIFFNFYVPCPFRTWVITALLNSWCLAGFLLFPSHLALFHTHSRKLVVCQAHCLPISLTLGCCCES